MNTGKPLVLREYDAMALLDHRHVLNLPAMVIPAITFSS